MAQSPPLAHSRNTVSVDVPEGVEGTEGTASAVQADHQLFRELTDRFTVLAEQCARFAQEVYRRAGTPPASDVEGAIRRNLQIARTVFGKGSIELLTAAYFNRSIALAEVQDALGGIPFPMLMGKLRHLERMGLLQRDVVGMETAETRYSLTHKGLLVARLGEPVFLYLRLTGGWQQPSEGGEVPEADEVEGRISRGTDRDRALRAVRGMDDIRGKLSGRWSGAKEVRMWRDLRG